MPRYFETWDVSTVLRMFKAWGQNDVLDLKQLSHKLAMLLAITSLHRGMELHLLNTCRMNIFSDRVEFVIVETLKHSKQGKTNKPSIFYSFRKDDILCPKLCIEAYLQKTLALREKSTEGPLFLALNKPHHPVTKDTVRRWITQTIEAAGVDSSKFTCHSTRGASSSAAAKAGVPIDFIVEKGNWSKSSTFERFYHKRVVTRCEKFQKGVLSVALN
jgi:hypothetical protein